MSQTAKVLGTCILILGIVFVGIVTNKNKGAFTTSKKGMSNWQWSDNWVVQKEKTENVEEKQEEVKEVKPEKPDDSDSVKPNKQITAKTYEEALEKSKEFKKPIFAFFSASWCDACKKMKNNVLSTQEVKEAMKGFVFVEIDADENREMAKKFNVGLLPTSIIINEKEQTVKATIGSSSPENFKKWLSSKSDDPISNDPPPDEDRRRKKK